MGVVNYCRNIWARLSHILALLTNITSSKVEFKWTKLKQGAVDEIKRIVTSNNLLTYPYFNE